MGPFDTHVFQSEHLDSKFFIITFTDIFSRWTETEILFSITSEDVIQAFEASWISKHGLPDRLLTDQGRQYISNRFATYCQENNIEKSTTSPYNPTANSVSERINQGITEVLRNSKGTHLTTLKNKISQKLNYNKNRNLGLSPAEIKFQTSAFSLSPQQKTISITQVKTRTEENILRTNREDNRKRRVIEYNVGDQVIRKNFKQGKLETKWLGPFQVHSVIDANRIELQEYSKRCIHNIKNIRPFHFPPSVQDDVDSA